MKSAHFGKKIATQGKTRIQISTMSKAKYYVRFKGRTLGPFEESKLRDMISRGQVTRLHEISTDGLSWQTAEQRSELFSSEEQQETIEATVVEEPSGDTQSEKNADKFPQTNTWYAHINGSNEGPVSESQLLVWKRNAQLTRDTLVWQEGMSDWQPADVALPAFFTGQSLSSSNNPSPDYGRPMARAENPQSDTYSGNYRAREPQRDQPAGMSITSMILGIISIVTCTGFFTGIPAIIFSAVALSRCSKGTGGGKGMAITGLTTGVISTVVSLSYILWIVFTLGVGSLLSVFSSI